VERFWSSTERRPGNGAAPTRVPRARHRSAYLAPALPALACMLAAGCGRMYLDNRPVVRGGAVAMPAVPSQATRTGSLWRDNVSANFMFTDVKARNPGDLITIVVSEDASGSKDAETSTKTKTAVSGSLSQFFGLPQQLQKHQPNIDPTALIEAESDREWDGQGTTNRHGKLSALMSAQVTEVAGNGNLWIEGEKIVSVNHEDQHLVIAGWVRPEDVNAQNEVLSSRVALGRIDYYGVGVVGMKQRPGWGYWALDWVWPF
jgi:flagellar L-ring protein precursor FlgH